MSAAAVIIIITPPPKRQNSAPEIDPSRYSWSDLKTFEALGAKAANESLAQQVAAAVRAALDALEAPDDEPPQRRDPAGPADRL